MKKIDNQTAVPVKRNTRQIRKLIPEYSTQNTYTSGWNYLKEIREPVLNALYRSMTSD